MLTQIDEDGYTLTLTEGIIDYEKDQIYASKKYMYVVTKRGRKRPRKKNADWKLLVQWKDKYEYWIHLKDMKDHHPVDVAEFTKARIIAYEPAFTWWFPYTLRMTYVIISAVKHRIIKKIHKYSIGLTTTVEE